MHLRLLTPWRSKPKNAAGNLPVRTITVVLGLCLQYAVGVDFDLAEGHGYYEFDGDRTDRRAGAILISGIALGMRLDHSRPYIHGDLKPLNILINARGQSLIRDFGAVRFASHDMTMTPEGGSVYYAAPEAFEEGKPST
jgi:serine/threonine protein kinase